MRGNEPYLQVLITGTGRCGTGYMSKVLTSSGLPCGHESIFDYSGYYDIHKKLTSTRLKAESSWLAAPYTASPILSETKVVKLIRNPQLVVESIWRIGLFEKESLSPYRNFVYKISPWLEGFSGLEQVVRFYIDWNHLICCDYVHKVEDQLDGLFKFLGLEIPFNVFNNKKYNTRGDKSKMPDWNVLPKKLMDSFLSEMTQYNYSWGER